MRKRIMATALAAAFGLCGLALAQENPTRVEKEGAQRDQQGSRSDKDRNTNDRNRAGGDRNSMPAVEVAPLAKHIHSLADSIRAAETETGGKAIRGECCFKTGAARDGREGDVICVVTLVVGDNKLVEATVDTQTQKVIGKRDIDTYRTIGATGGMAAGRGAGGDFALADRWQKATDLMGKNVTNSANENLGEIEDIVVDARSGRIIYAVLSFGGVLGMGDKLFAIPWGSLDLAGDYKSFVLNVDKDRLKNAQGFDKDHWPNFADQQWATATYKHYNQDPYWRTRGSGQMASDGQPSGDDYRSRWYEPTTVWQKCSDLTGKDVHGSDNAKIGDMQDLAIDPDSGRILYGIVEHRGKLFAIPWGGITLTQDGKNFVLNVDKNQLTDQVGFTKDNWPNLTDERWSTDIYTHYHVTPYWHATVERRTSP